jgi:hypothetical protein
MIQITGGFLLLLTTFSVTAQPPTPAEQYKQLLKEANAGTGAPFPNSDEERLKYVGDAYKHRHTIALKFLALAEKHPSDPIALDALLQAVWQVNTIPWPIEMVGEDAARPKAFAQLERDHLQSDKLVPLCHRVSYGFCKEYESFLRAVLAKNPHRNVQAVASLSLGHFLHNRMQRVDLCREQPEQDRDFAGLFGNDYLAQLKRQDNAKTLREIEALFEDASKKHGDTELPYGGTVAKRAALELFEIRHLSVGKEAPDIDAADQHGKRFKLSDYRGKVVLLDFWSYV